MAFVLRNGPESRRTNITPQLGEPIYVTDTGRVYVGDASTPGGVLLDRRLEDETAPKLTNNLDLNGNNITGTGNVNIDGFITATGNINLGDGTEDNVVVGGVIESDLLPSASDTYDLGTSARFWRSVHADSVTSNSIESTYFLGDVEGSVLGLDSSIIVDHRNNSISVPIISVPDEEILVSAQSDNTTLKIVSNDTTNKLEFLRTSNTDLASSNLQYGLITFAREDINGKISTAGIGAGTDNLYFVTNKNDITGSSGGNYTSIEDGNMTIGGKNPQAKLDVRGDAVVQSSFQFGKLTSTERDNLTPTNGTIIYNVTANRFQGFQNNSWINLDNGTAA